LSDEKQIDTIKKCTRLGKEDVFADSEIGNKQEAYQYAFWHTMSLKDHDLLSQTEQAGSDLAQLISKKLPEDESNALRDKAQNYITDAVTSNDADALFQVGFILVNGRYSSDPARGIALSLAACDLGYDCSANNPDKWWGQDLDFNTALHSMMGEQKFAQAYNQSQEVTDLIRRKDYDGLRKYFQLQLQ
jgi:hypothetical protein